MLDQIYQDSVNAIVSRHFICLQGDLGLFRFFIRIRYPRKMLDFSSKRFPIKTFDISTDTYFERAFDIDFDKPRDGLAALFTHLAIGRDERCQYENAVSVKPLG